MALIEILSHRGNSDIYGLTRGTWPSTGNKAQFLVARGVTLLTMLLRAPSRHSVQNNKNRNLFHQSFEFWAQIYTHVWSDKRWIKHGSDHLISTFSETMKMCDAGNRLCYPGCNSRCHNFESVHLLLFLLFSFLHRFKKQRPQSEAFSKTTPSGAFWSSATSELRGALLSGQSLP